MQNFLKTSPPGEIRVAPLPAFPRAARSLACSHAVLFATREPCITNSPSFLRPFVLRTQSQHAGREENPHVEQSRCAEIFKSQERPSAESPLDFAFVVPAAFAGAAHVGLRALWPVRNFALDVNLA